MIDYLLQFYTDDVLFQVFPHLWTHEREHAAYTRILAARFPRLYKSLGHTTPTPQLLRAALSARFHRAENTWVMDTPLNPRMVCFVNGEPWLFHDSSQGVIVHATSTTPFTCKNAFDHNLIYFDSYSLRNYIVCVQSERILQHPHVHMLHLPSMTWANFTLMMPESFTTCDVLCCERGQLELFAYCEWFFPRTVTVNFAERVANITSHMHLTHNDDFNVKIMHNDTYIFSVFVTRIQVINRASHTQLYSLRLDDTTYMHSFLFHDFVILLDDRDETASFFHWDTQTLRKRPTVPLGHLCSTLMLYTTNTGLAMFYKTVSSIVHRQFCIVDA